MGEEDVSGRKEEGEDMHMEMNVERKEVKKSIIIKALN